jgi:intein/homing endonuclease
MIPDIIMNPHCFVGETLIGLPNGMARRIDSFSSQGMEPVLSFDDNGSIRSYSLGMESKGIQDTIKLTLIDGREIICTPDHKIRVLDEDKPIWKEAQYIDYNDKILMGLSGTEDIKYEDENDWSLDIGLLTLTMKDEYSRNQSLAFARLIGYILTDGTICELQSKSKKELTCVSRLSAGTLIDIDIILDDIEIVTGKRPAFTKDKSKTNNSEVYYISIPKCLSKHFNKLAGLTIGRRTTQEASLPEFIFTSPKSIVREFIAGLMGGDGWMPHYSSSNKNTFSQVKFSQSICEEYKETLEKKMLNIIDLMKSLGVDAEIVRTRECAKHCQSYIDRPRVSIELTVRSNIDFRKNIGFRYCINKMLRLEATCAYENYCNQVKIQHNNMFNRVNELINSKPKSNVKGKSIISESLEIAKNEIYENTKILNEYYSLLTPTLVSNRRKKNRSNQCNVFDYKHMMNAQEFVETYGCSSWFNKNEYILKRDSKYSPSYYLSIMKKEKYSQKEVFDIGVMETHAFIAQGCFASNCIPSRMTVAQLVECMASKVGALVGEFIDGTPFNDYDIKQLPEILKQLGYSPHGTEKMYCGMTGEVIDAEIFIGPTYQIRLKHLVQDKVHGRARGPRQALTRQPLEGRSRDGGLKIGKPFCLKVRMQIRC